MKSVFSLMIPMAVALSGCSRPTPEVKANAMAEPPSIAVVTRASVLQPMPRYLRVTGELKGEQQSQVAADVAGKVVEAPVERGSVVKKGDVLVKLDERNAALSLQEAEATLESVKLKLDWQRSEMVRNEPLAKTKAIAESDFQKIKMDLTAAEASHAASVARRDLAKKALADTSILAPFSGTVADRLSNVGEYVGANTPVVQLVATEQLRLTLNVPETAVGSISEDQEVVFKVPAHPDTEFRGRIKFIGAAVREASRDLQVEAEVPNADGRLKPGMFAEGRVALAEAEGVAVPASSVRTDGNTSKVFLVEDGRVAERLVEVGETKGDVVEIRRGLTKGEAVIVAPTAEAVDGRKVKL